ncbi:unnamed protein product, partial [Gulo gulo]
FNKVCCIRCFLEVLGHADSSGNYSLRIKAGIVLMHEDHQYEKIESSDKTEMEGIQE